MRPQEVLSLYRILLRESRKFPAYNFREYAIRRIRHGFRENKNISNETKIKEMHTFAVESLEMIKRQVIIGQLYTSPPLVIEKPKK